MTRRKQDSGQSITGSYNAQADRGGTANVIVYDFHHSPRPSAKVIATAERHIAKIPSDAIPALQALPEGSRMPLRTNPLYVGRDTDMLGLAAAIKNYGRAVLTGVGGVGKTQLACEFVHRYGQYFLGGVFWISFAEPSNIGSEIAACGYPGHLRLRVDFTTLPLAEQIRLVLAEWQSPMPRLLILDNCEDPALLDELPLTTGGGRVMVTSRRGEWDASVGLQPVRLRELTRSDSITLLRHNRIDPSIEDSSLGEIADELGDLPLALHLAGSFLASHRHSISPSEYLTQLRHSDLLQHQSMTAQNTLPTRHERNVARTFALSYERLDDSQPVDELARRLLASTGYLAPNQIIPRDLLILTLMMPDVPETYLQVDDSLARLIALGLIEAQEEDGALRIHRLIRQFVRGQQTDEKTLTTVEEAIGMKTFHYNESKNIPAFLLLIPHLRFVVDAARSRSDALAAELCSEFAKYLDAIGDYPNALQYFERALAIQGDLNGQSDPLTATFLENVGLTLEHMGRLAEARPLIERALAVRLGAYGWNHPATALSLNNMGVLLSSQGDFREARPFYGRSLAIRIHLDGDHRNDISQSMNNIGDLLQRLGDYKGAKKFLSQVLALRMEMFGENHALAARSLNNMGAILQNMRDFLGARLHYERSLAVRVAVLGERHPETAQSMANIGGLCIEEGNYSMAWDWFQQALDIQGEVLGENHPQTALTLNNLGAIRVRSGEYAKAVPGQVPEVL
jgi:tetratricopeptide (TPR) repeat protein